MSTAQTDPHVNRAQDLVDDLAAKGVRIWVDGDQLRLRSPDGVLTPELTHDLRSLKPSIISLLSGRYQPSISDDRKARHEEFPLSDMQQVYRLGESSDFDLGGVRAHAYSEFDLPDLDVPRATWVLNELVRRHEMLRAVVVDDAHQRILAKCSHWEIPETDLRTVSPEERAAVLEDTRQRMTAEGPRTDTWPLFEVRAHQLSERIWRLHIGCSLLIIDGMSLRTLVSESLALYQDKDTSLPPIDVSYRDYLLALTDYENAPAYQRAEHYWFKRLDELPGAPELPLSRAGRHMTGHSLARRVHHLSAAEWSSFQDSARHHGLFPAAALCTAYCEVLARWSKTQRFTLNVLDSQRLPVHDQIGDVVGNFSATSLTEFDGTGARSFVDAATRFQKQRLADRQHGLVSGVRVLRERNRRQRAVTGAAMPVVFNSLDGVADLDHDWLRNEVWGRLLTPQVLLDHQVMPRAGAVDLYWDVVEDAFAEDVIDSMFAAYGRLVRGLAWDREMWLSPVGDLRPPEQRRSHARANATDAPQEVRRLEESFLHHAAAAPEAPAVVTKARTLTYGQLDERSAAIAGWLADHQVRHGELVGVMAGKGWEQVASVCGVLRAGAAYLPIDARLPSSRIEKILAVGEARFVLADEQSVHRVTWPTSTDVALVTDDSPRPGRPPSTASQRPDDLAYVIFTSGSTGVPKGVIIDHRAALNTIDDISQRFAITSSDRILAVSSLGFDLSVYDLFGLLGAGGTVVVPPESGTGRDPEDLLACVAQHGVTVWNSVPATVELAVEHLEAHRGRFPPSLRLIMMSGDWIPVALPDRIRALGDGIQIVSLGGATEAAIWSIVHEIDAVGEGWSSIPYGKPLRNQRFHVLNASMQPCPTHVAGELYIAGNGLARGYWRDRQQTAQRFVVHPHSGERLYRTGDWGRYLADGSIEFLGREDLQVKVNGYRIELGDVEAALGRHPSVRSTVVLAYGERDRRQLVGYWVPEEGYNADPAHLRAWLKDVLPPYMIPAHLVALTALPLTPNGKVDRQALPGPGQAGGRVPGDGAAPGGGGGEPQDDIERYLLDVFADLLGTRRLGRKSDFFENGGDSLRAVRLAAAATARYGTDVSIRTVLDAPTVAELATEIRGQADHSSRPNKSLFQFRGGDGTPLLLVHPVGGNVACYRQLAGLLGDRPVFGLEAAAVDDTPDAALGELAALYTSQVRHLCQPGTPVVLGGWSMGGIVALEMAAQLESSGDEILGVLLIDSLLPPVGMRWTEATLLDRFLRDLGVPPDARVEATDALDREGRDGTLQWMVRKGVLPGLGAEHLEQHFRLFSRNMLALSRHEARPCQSGVLEVRALNSWLRADWRDPLDRAPLVHTVDVPADHDTILLPPHLHEVASHIRHFLEQLHSRSPSGPEKVHLP